MYEKMKIKMKNSSFSIIVHIKICFATRPYNGIYPRIYHKLHTIVDEAQLLK